MAAHRALTIELIRDGQCTPWGFRMSGGADIGTPLLIQRINMGSPAEGELQKGDIILAIGDHDARKLSHQRATDIIAKAGNNLKFVVARSSGPPPSVSSGIMSPTPGTPVTMYYLKSNTTMPSTVPLGMGHGNPDLFKPLPKTEFHNEASRTTASYQTLYDSTTDEKKAIANQAYRTLPLITPTLKTTKDYPIGSYLRHNPDTSGRSKSTNSTGSRVNDAYMLTKLQEAVLEKALSSPRASVSSSRTPTPDSGYQSIYHRQYNSPINLYSTQSLVETINAQTSAHKQLPFAEALKDVIVDAMTYFSESPRVQTPTKFQPPDLSKSPTYQMIHEEEWKELNKQKLEEHTPVENKVYNIEEPPQSGFGPYDIPQSSSFKHLMSNLGKGITNI